VFTEFETILRGERQLKDNSAAGGRRIDRRFRAPPLLGGPL